jgi:hypothetical protein
MLYTHLPKSRLNNLHNLYKSEEEIGGESLQKAEESDMLLKGRKADPIGTKKMWGSKEYVKTAKGWTPSKAAKAAHDTLHGTGDQHAQTDSFEHNGHTITRHNTSATQGTYTVHKDGKQIGEGHYSQELHAMQSKNDGRPSQFKKRIRRSKMKLIRLLIPMLKGKK